MKAALFHDHGGPEVLRIEEVATPTPRAHEVLVRVHAAALNHLDLLVRRGLPIQITMPHIGGSDIAGTVSEVGAGVRDVAIGTRVVVNPSLSCGACEWCKAGEQSVCADYQIIGEHVQGGFAEFVTVPAENLFELPAKYDFERAAAAPLVFMTAWRALVSRARLQSGESVLITGASGGVSTAAIQIAKHIGATVYAVTTSDNIGRVRKLGADVVYDRNVTDYARELWQTTRKRGVDVVLDSVGEPTWADNLRSLARTGRLIIYGATAGAKVDLDLRQLFWKQYQILGTTMANRSEFEAAMKLVFSGSLQPVVDVTLPLAQIRTAHERLERGDQFGKIVLVP